MQRRATATAAGAVAAVLLAGCGGDDGDEQAELPAGCERVEAPAPKQVELAEPKRPLRGPATAVVATSCGNFEVSLDTARSPRTSASFAHLAREGVYDDTPIHRIEPGFVIQGGDPAGDGTGGPGYFVDELPPQNLSYTRGIVAMAKTGAEPPGRSGSQFFVVTAADAGLSPDFALLGEVTSGLDVVERIEQLGGPGGEPSAPVVIEAVMVEGG